MKLKVFYSWLSDLPNKTNRGFIQDCLEKALINIHKENRSITEWMLETDSRGESGTPELASTIFSKIDQCDIFIADISIINQKSKSRKVCNPNVLIELGYASSKIGWEKILSVFNLRYGIIEDLPFDLRHRKPLTYKDDKSNLIGQLTLQIQSILDNHFSNKKYFISLKREIDLSLQAILIDITKIIYFSDRINQYNYNLLLHISRNELLNELAGRKLLGFQLFKNNKLHLDEFNEFFNNQIHLSFLNERERLALAKIILQFKRYVELIPDLNNYNPGPVADNLHLINASKMNSSNQKDLYILGEKLKDNKSVVLDSGIIDKIHLPIVTQYYIIKFETIGNFISVILDLAKEINEWIRITGSYFILNDRLLSNQAVTKEDQSIKSGN